MTDRWTRLALLPVRLWERLGTRGLVLAAIVACLPMAFVGFQLDDLPQRALLARSDANLLDLFRFVRSPEDVARFQREALLPWWADPNLRVAFFRPISAFTHWIDGRIAPAFFPWHALHTAAWYALACLGAAAVYRKTLGERVPAAVTFATAAFALDATHGPTLGWLANRNAVVAAAFGCWAVAAHLAGRRWAAAALLGLALFSGEAGLGTLAYLGAATLFFDQRRDRWKALVYALPVAAWAWMWVGGGYGAAHNDGYFDVVGQPRAFVSLVAERLPMLWATAWKLDAADAWMMLDPPTAHTFARWALAAFFPLLWLCWPLIRTVWPTHADPYPDLVPSRGARVLLVGSLLALVPMCAALPSSRLLLLSGLGVSGLAGSLAAALLRGGLGRARTVAAGLVLALQGLVAPLLLPAAILNVRTFADLGPAPWEGVLTAPEDDGTTAIALQAPVDLFAGYLPYARRLAGAHGPDRVYAIGPSLQRAVVERLDDRTLRMQVDRGFGPPPGTVPELPTVGFHLVAQRLDRTTTDGCPHYDGDVVDLGPFEVRVVEPLPDGRAATVDLVFDVPLEDPSLRFVSFVGGRAVRWIPVAPGETAVLPANPIFPEDPGDAP